MQMVTRTPKVDWAALRYAIAGNVIVPGSPEYDSVRKPPNARFWHVQLARVNAAYDPGDIFPFHPTAEPTQADRQPLPAPRERNPST